jgi:hypothetical protein
MLLGPLQRPLHLTDPLRQVVPRRGQEAAGQQDLAAEDVPRDPEDLVADVGLEAVDGQDHPAGRGGRSPEPRGVRERERQRLVVAVQQVADAADADRHAAADQLGVDLRDAAVLGVAEPTDQGDDVEPELVPRPGEAALLFGSEADLVSGAFGIAAAADPQARPEKPLQGDDGSPRPGRGPERTGAGGAGPRVGGQFQGLVGGGPSTPSRRGATPRGGAGSRSNNSVGLHQTDFATLGSFPGGDFFDG